MSNYFDNAKVGDKVKCFLYGEGEIEAVLLQNKYPIWVRFFYDNTTASYALDGKLRVQSKTQILFYADDCPESIPYPKKKVIKEIKGWVNVSETGIVVFGENEKIIKEIIAKRDIVKIAPATLTYEFEE